MGTIVIVIEALKGWSNARWRFVAAMTTVSALAIGLPTDVIPNPRDSRVLEANDRLLCFGNLESMREMIPARRRRRARVRKLPAHPLPDDAA